MPITQRQNELYTDLLFKKVAAGVSTSNPDTPFFEQPITGRSFVDLEQIWAQSDQILNSAAPIPGVVEQLTSFSMVPIAGFPLSFWFGVKKKIIPFNFGDGTSYNYILLTDTSEPIFAGTNDWYLDPDTGVVTFLDGNPPGVGPNNAPVFTGWEYVGLTAKDTGLGGGSGSGTGSIGEWQDSVLGYSDSLTGAGTSGLPPAFFDIYTDPLLTPPAIQAPLTNGLRLIHIGFQVNDVPIYDPEIDETTTGSILGNDIITWWDSTANGTTNGGWVLFRPTTGTFSSVDLNENSVIRYTGSAWINQYFEKTIPREQNLIPEISVNNLDLWQIISNDTILENPSIPDTTLYINNVKINDIGLTPGYKFGSTTNTDVSASITNGTNTTFDIIGGSGTSGTSGGIFFIGQVLLITSPAYGFVNIVDIQNSTVTVSSDVGGAITSISSTVVTVSDNVIDAVKAFGLANVRIFWNSLNSGYAIENDDLVTINHSVIEN